MIVSKLPNDLKRSWRDYHYLLVERGISAKFVHLEEFVKRKSGMMNYSVFSKVTDDRKPKKEEEIAQKKRTFNSKLNKGENSRQNRSSNEVAGTVCLYCSASHLIADCRKFGS